MAKRKTGKREANGRLQRPTLAQLKNIEAERYRENMQQVASQPHRVGFRDPMDPRLESALGRFCVIHGLRRELYQAGLDWAEMRRSWNSAKGVPDSEHHGGMGTGQGPSPETVERWKRRLFDIDEALYDHNAATMWATRRLCIDGWTPTGDFVPFVVKGLAVVALTLGAIDAKEHPFERAA